jgi:hypothetical protein
VVGWANKQALIIGLVEDWRFEGTIIRSVKNSSLYKWFIKEACK